ncbi:hypothetical protein AF332_15480 [Sporosarcina globispora]|uniref:Uncharacterized protein n=1 Tax=Sporosarcina globispora TaxID=1459 RepID=A0A0M0GDZ4_SPOGL|nr:hypothetical protein AF332_15480 [Sporosarcina globispora]
MAKKGQKSKNYSVMKGQSYVEIEGTEYFLVEGDATDPTSESKSLILFNISVISLLNASESSVSPSGALNTTCT